MSLANPCSLVVAYEDMETARHAQESYGFLLKRAGQELQEAVTSLWKFNLLQNHKLCELAAGEATQADMVIISTHGDRELPQETKHWIELWKAGRRVRPGTLALLFDRSGESGFGRAALRTYLEEVAGQCGMEFVAETAEWQT